MRLYHHFSLSIAMLPVFLMCGTDTATAKPPYVSPEQVKEQAQVILTGKVDSFRTRDEERHPSAEGRPEIGPRKRSG